MWPAGIILSIVSGALLTAGFPKTDLYAVSWAALIPLLVAVRGKSGREAFFLGYVCGLTHYATAMYWIWYVVQYYGGLPFPVAAAILFLLCAYLALYIGVFAALARKWEQTPLLWILGLPCAWVALEFLRAYALSGFPWSNLGYTQTNFSTLIQFSDITGVYGVSWLVVLGNTTIAACFYRVRVRTAIAVFCICAAAAIVYGRLRLEVVGKLQERSAPFTVAVIQGNIDQSKKWDPAFQQETLRRYRELSLEAANGSPTPDLLVWPETAAPFLYGMEEKLTAHLNDIALKSGKPILFGSPGATVVGGRVHMLNRAYLTDERASTVGAYAKRHLVPFGEYVPFQDILFFVNKLTQAAGDFIPGTDPSPIHFNGRPLGMLICYEGIFPDLARETVRSGATSLYILTNDAWYGDTSAPYQHLQIGRWRAIEFRVPLVRAANTGISAVFDAAGNQCGSIALNRQGHMVCSIHPIREITFYAARGDVFAWMCVLAAIAGLLFSRLKGRQRT